MSTLNCLIRTDASKEIGSGHLMRCLALAEYLASNGWKVSFLSQGILEGDFDTYQISNTQNDATETKQLAEELGINFLILDGYGFDAEYQLKAMGKSYSLLVVDDHGYSEEHHADIILNPTPTALKENGSSKYLQGPDYCLLRNDFTENRPAEAKKIEQVKNIFVCFGGSDKDNVSLEVVQALEEIGQDDTEVNLIVGPHNPNLDDLELFLGESKLDISIKFAVANMSEEISQADLAIIAGGTMVWEVAALGVPAAGICIAENQRKVLKFLDGKTLKKLENRKLSEELKELIENPAELSKLAQQAFEFIDCRGRERIEAEMRKHVR